MTTNIIHNVDCLVGLRKLPDNCVDCCITSPPYFNMRDYGVSGQIGLEGTPEAYIHRLVEVFREVRRVLKPTGTLWVNIGDSYAGSGKGAANYPDSVAHTKQGTNRGMVGATASVKKFAEYKNKDLIGIPWMLAFVLRADGWYLRQDIIWAKSNPMPESVHDRCTKSHEYIFLLSKSKRYYFDYAAIAQPAKTLSRAGTVQAVGSRRYEQMLASDPQQRTNTDRSFTYAQTARKRDVWFVSVKPYKGAHFATFPETLVVDCIKARCPEGGIVLDPFMGAGTTTIVARMLSRNYIGHELNAEYVRIAEERLKKPDYSFNLNNHENSKSNQSAVFSD